MIIEYTTAIKTIKTLGPSIEQEGWEDEVFSYLFANECVLSEDAIYSAIEVLNFEY